MIDRVNLRTAMLLSFVVPACGLIYWFPKPQSDCIAITLVIYGILSFLQPPKGSTIGAKKLRVALAALALLSILASAVFLFLA